MIFEFVGLPATGKTTAIVALEKAGIAERVRLPNKVSIIYWFLFGLIRYPRSICTGAYIVLRHRPKLYVIWNYCIVRHALLVKAQSMPKGLWLIDEPPLQNIYSLMSKDFTPEALANIFSKLFTVGQVLYFSVDEAERERRKRERNRQNMPNEFNPDWNRRLLEADACVREALSKRTDVFFATGEQSDVESYIISYA